MVLPSEAAARLDANGVLTLYCTLPTVGGVNINLVLVPPLTNLG